MPNLTALVPDSQSRHDITASSAIPRILTNTIDHFANARDILDSSTSISICAPVLAPNGIDSATMTTRDSASKSSAPWIGKFLSLRMINTLYTL